MCDYKKYNEGGTNANYHVLPLYTKTTDECQRYFDRSITDKDYSILEDDDGKIIGYICLPYCNVDNNTCTNKNLSINSDNTWSVNGQKTEYQRHINKYMPTGSWSDRDNACVLLDDETKTCESDLDRQCCGSAFGSVGGTDCDRLGDSKLFLTTCHTEGSRSECCDHGVCKNGICVCDAGYTGNCCVCANGYHKDPTSGNCVPDYCCDESTFQVRQIPNSQCTGPNDKPVNDGTAASCWPNGTKSWCSEDKSQCLGVVSPFVWGQLRDKLGTLVDNDCQQCFPADLYYCDEKSSCSSQVSAAAESDECSKKGRSFWVVSAAILIFVCGALFIFSLLKNKKNK